MERSLKAIEASGVIDEQRQLHLDILLPIGGPSRVRVKPGPCYYLDPRSNGYRRVRMVLRGKPKSGFRVSEGPSRRHLHSVRREAVR